MKKGIIAAIIVGASLLVVGGVLFAVGVANNKPDPIVTKTYEVNEFTNINVDINTADLEFKYAEDGVRKVVCEEREKQYHTVEVKDNTLNIKAFDDRKWYENIFRINFDRMKVTIFTLENEYEYNDLTISSHTGNVRIPKLYSFNNLNLKLSTGDIYLGSNVINITYVESSTGNIILEMNTKSLTAKASTGHVTLSKVEVTEDTVVETSTGNITLRDCKANNLSLTASTGDINLSNTTINQHIAIKTSTGDVDFTDIDANTLDIETTTGHVRGSLLTSKVFDAQSKTGDVNVPLSGEGGLCKIRTRTGSIYITIKG